MFYSCFIEAVRYLSAGHVPSEKNKQTAGYGQSLHQNCKPDLELPLLYEVQTLKKAQSILADPHHHLSTEFKLLPSRRRYNLTR